jgi:hypothetical protein
VHTPFLPLDAPSTWLIALAFIVALVLASRALQKLTGRSGKPSPGRGRIAYYAVLCGGMLGSLLWIGPALHVAGNPVFVGMVAGVWSLVAQGLFGKPMG